MYVRSRSTVERIHVVAATSHSIYQVYEYSEREWGVACTKVCVFLGDNRDNTPEFREEKHQVSWSGALMRPKHLFLRIASISADVARQGLEF